MEDSEIERLRDNVIEAGRRLTWIRPELIGKRRGPMNEALWEFYDAVKALEAAEKEE